MEVVNEYQLTDSLGVLVILIRNWINQNVFLLLYINIFLVFILRGSQVLSKCPNTFVTHYSWPHRYFTMSFDRPIFLAHYASMIAEDRQRRWFVRYERVVTHAWFMMNTSLLKFCTVRNELQVSSRYFTLRSFRFNIFLNVCSLFTWETLCIIVFPSE